MPTPVRYVGHAGEGIRVPHPDPEMPGATTVTSCPPGEAVELPDEQARSLIDAGICELVDPPRRRPPKTEETAKPVAEED